MDDLMNKVGALIEEHVKSEVEARREHFEKMTWERGEVRKILNAGACEPIEEAAARVARHRDALLVDNAALRDQPSKDEIRRGARALGFWEKLVETLSDGRVEDANFDDVMAKIQALREERDSIARIADIRFKVIEAERSVADDALARRDKAVADAEEKTDAIDNLRTILKDEREALDAMRKERDTVVQQFEWMREERDAANRSANKYRVMWEQLHRAQSEEVGAAGQLKELLSALGLAHFDRSTIEDVFEARRERDKRLVAERDDAIASVQSWREKAQALEAKLLEVRKAVGEKAPEESAKAPPKQSEFQVGDLVARHPRGPGCWGKVHAVDGDYVQVSYPAVGEGLYWHMERELTRKPVEVGDTVRVTIESHAGKRGKLEVLGESDRWCDMVRLDESSLLYVPRRYLVAIAP